MRPTLETERWGMQDHSSRTCSAPRSTERGVEEIYEARSKNDWMTFFLQGCSRIPQNSSIRLVFLKVNTGRMIKNISH